MPLKKDFYKIFLLIFVFSCAPSQPILFDKFTELIRENYISKDVFELFVEQTEKNLNRLEKDIEKLQEDNDNLQKETSILQKEVCVLRERTKHLQNYINLLTKNFENNEFREVKISPKEEKIIKQRKNDIIEGANTVNDEFKRVSNGLALEDDALQWWDSLNEEWKIFFVKYYQGYPSKQINFLEEALFGFTQKRKLYNKTSFNFNGHTLLKNEKLSNLRGLEKMKNLIKINISSNLIESEDLKIILNLNNLEELNLNNNDIDDLSIFLHSNFPNLKKLYISNNGIYSIATLRVLKNLIYLDCRNNDINSLKGIEDLLTLQELDCGNNPISNIEDLESLIKNPKSTIQDLQLPSSVCTRVQIFANKNNRQLDITPIN